ncbi:diacylglycerol/lipid kinase family protein [Dyadobacter sandarakinus]|uniref:Diacylglycerol kinase n=1 Tax=Dyadobacter sandarakinus TaxID=2747268 RepID=A0ABX7I2A2_9BACT|nr:diacylglycerol kinase family protein [Dyadobacter sandarakinus]QRQ99953.1 diacylglycerol kinase [Dyadobacter sandarakinus]
MKKVRLLHNPTAGDNDFTKEELVRLIGKEGFDCTYASVRDEKWDDFEEDTDFLIIAGGDGTVRRVSKALMNRKRLDKQFPLALLPHGTANNIAGALQVEGSVRDIVRSWHHDRLKLFDIGKVYGLDKDLFFLESFGFGIFPRLMKVMEKIHEEIGDSAEEKIRAARAMLYDVLLNYEASECRIVADGAEHSGKYVMVEIMNISSIGPNLALAPWADPGDGELEIVTVAASQRSKFETFLLNQINGVADTFHFTTIRGKNIAVYWEGKDVHADDELLKMQKSHEIQIKVQPGMLEFLVKQ